MCPGQHFIQHTSKRENVPARIGFFAAHLFRRHVAGRSHDYAGSGRKSAGYFGVTIYSRTCTSFGQLGQAEIQNLGPAVACDEDIFRLQITMNDSLLVCRSQAVRNLQCVVDGFALRHSLRSHQLAQRCAF